MHVCRRAYRGLYMINWLYRYLTETHYRQWIVWISGGIQTALYGGEGQHSGERRRPVVLPRVTGLDCSLRAYVLVFLQRGPLCFADFFYYYFQCWKANKRLQLPA
jgi:ER lumen protein retaining receptor